MPGRSGREWRFAAGIGLAILAGIVLGRWYERPAAEAPVIAAAPRPTATPAPPAAAPPRLAPGFQAPPQGQAATPAAVDAAAAQPASAGGLIDVNTADQKLLETLPGIGPAKARAILDDRAAKGPFRSAEDLDRVSGIGPKTVERLRPYLSFGAAEPPAAPAPAPAAKGGARIAVNRASAAELEALAGIGPALAARIVEHRRQRGPIRGERDLLAVKGIGPKIIEENRDRISYE
ncbi:MAG: ComEA family DNA-binding protein [Candidatus Sumerlaeia bacterium]|nr:ComEA family DNA-binding protein [Candidatus Sumerlaeia bacterium]